MKLNELMPSVPRKARKRVGRGESSGLGKTSGKGSTCTCPITISLLSPL